MQFETLFKRAVAFFLIIATVFCMCAISSYADDAYEKLEEARRQADQLKEEIDALKATSAEKQTIKEATEKQIANTEAQIEIVARKLEAIDAEIAQLEAELNAKEAQLEAKKELFKKRLRAIYMSAGNGGDLQVLLGSDSMSDYLAKSELTRSVAQYDSHLIEEIVKAVEAVKQDYAVVEKKRDEQAAVKKDLAATRATLSQQVHELADLISEIEVQTTDKQAALDEYNKEIDELEEEIAKAIAGSLNGNIIYSGGQFAWPVPGYYYVSSGYAWRWGRMHNGIDIAGGGISGKPIVAAADGQVITASGSSGGYGNYVMINHGSGYVTLYGHMTYYCVSVGQYVSTGDTIGYVGSTGNSTGPHLHYEIRVNGSPNDPLNFYR